MVKDIKVIVAGCRDFFDYELLKAELNILIAPGVIDRKVEIVSGCAKGADALGEKYAAEYGLSVKKFPADWSKGKQAGYLRNKQMAEYATHCVCFWDGISRGTELMIMLAQENKLRIEVIIFENKK